MTSFLETTANELKRWDVEVARLQEDTLLCCPVGWIAVTLRFATDERSQSIRGWHRITPLFGPADAAFEIAVGDRSRSALANLVSQASWRLDAKGAREIVAVLAREIPGVLRDFGTPGAFATNAADDPNDLSDLPELAEALVIAHLLADQIDQAIRIVHELGRQPSSIPEQTAAVAEAREVRALRMAALRIVGICGDEAESLVFR